MSKRSTARRSGTDTHLPAGSLRLVAAKGVPPPQSVVELDREAFALARREAVVRRSLGLLASAFLRMSGHRPLGFALVGDYARERLGISGREIQDLVTVARRLDTLPRIGDALIRGEISWSHARLLAGVACPETEADWLSRGRGKTVRALVREIRRWRKDGTADAETVAREPDHDTQGTGVGWPAPIEPGQDTPAGRAGLLRHVIDGLARPVNGHQQTRPGDPALLRRAIDNETGSIEGEEMVRFRIRCPAWVRLLWRRGIELARRMEGSRVSLWQVADAIAGEGLSGADPGKVALCDPEPDSSGTEEACSATVARGGVTAEAERSAAAFPSVDWEVSSSGDPEEELSALCVELGEVRRLTGIVPAGATAAGADGENTLAGGLLGPYALDRRMRAIAASLQGLDARMGRVLRRMIDQRAFVALRFGSFERYAQERLGMSASRAAALVRIDRIVGETESFGAAWRSGALSWVRAQEILPLVRGPHAGEWVARAGEVHVVRLAEEVEWALAVRDAALASSGEGAPAVPPPRSVEAASMTATTTPRDLLENAIARAVATGGAVTGPAVAPPPLNARLDLPDLQMCARRPGEVADCEVTFYGPASVVATFRMAIAAFTGPSEVSWEGFERLLRHVLAEWESRPRHRDPIFERDKWRCTVGPCSARRDLHDHHRLYRSRGGGNQRWNRTAACFVHHGLIHAGFVRAYGRAPDNLTWELGVRPGREPLLTFRGSRYVRRDL